MATYKNRAPMDAGTELRRYITIDAFVQIFRNRQLRLTRVDKFPDRFEGSVPKKEIDNQVAIFSTRNIDQMMSVAAYYPGMSTPRRPNIDPWTEMTRRRRAKTRSAHASCWTAGPESEAMWRLYCRDAGMEGLGVALQSTLGKVEASVTQHDLTVSPISYRHYHIGDPFTDELDAFMHKRLGFAHEREVRLLKFDESHYLKLVTPIASGGDPNAVMPSELDEYIYLDWSPVAVIERITISPYADEAYEARARDAVESIDPSLVDRLELSVLSDRRYKPEF